jgi:hypothetical protein
MADAFKKGEKVQWDSSTGLVCGTVLRKLTRPTEIKGLYIQASENNPQYLVQSDHSGTEVAHRPETLRKLH